MTVRPRGNLLNGVLSGDTMVDGAHVVARLQELRGWSDYILDSLIADQPYEDGKLAILRSRAGERELKEARELAAALAAKLHTLATLVELTPENAITSR